MLARFARWGERRGVALDLAGADLNPKSAAVARARLCERVRRITSDYCDLVGHGWDINLSSLLSHHMTPAPRSEFLRFMESEAASGWRVRRSVESVKKWVGGVVLGVLGT